jgi:acetyltransferase-like isoleucine patch superfamily enzyme
METKKNTLDFCDLALGNWRIAFLKAPNLCLAVTFHEDGGLTGMPEDRGSHWQFDDKGKLAITRADGFKTIVFDEVFLFAEEGFVTGTYRRGPQDSPIIVWLQRMTPAFSFLNNWTAYVLRNQIDKFGWDIGAYTYGIPTIIDERLSTLTIGRFCSIAANVNIALGHHRMDIVSTYPFETLNSWMQDWPGSPDIPDHGTNGNVVIGSDVWIASGVFIASGVTIGHGAVVAAQSVVTKDVPPYAVVGGNTAKIIRYRFDEVTIARLLKLRWWDWPAEKINRCLPLMISDNIEAFLEQAH